MGWLERTPRRAVRYAGAGVCFLAAAWFYGDFLLFRIMAIHLAKGLRILTEGGWQQLWLTVEATGVRKQVLWQGLAGLVVLAVAGAGLVRGARCLSNRWPVRLGGRALLWWLVGLVVIALALDYWGQHSEANRRAWQELKRVMPFHVALWHSAPGVKLAGARLRPLRSPQETTAALAAASVPAGPRPDIFLFILESTRGD